MYHMNEHLLMIKANTFTISIQFRVINDSDLPIKKKRHNEMDEQQRPNSRISPCHAKPRYQNEQRRRRA